MGRSGPRFSSSVRRQRLRRRRALAGLGALAVFAVCVGAWAATRGSEEPAAGGGGGKDGEARADAPPPELPRGGRRIFPDHRVVGFYGAPQSEELGALGIGRPDGAARRLLRVARPYERKSRPVLPALELIAVIAQADGGEDGQYRFRQPDSIIRRYLKAARKVKGLLLLDIQPGRADFFTETERLRKWLKEPDVGLALDPEWRVNEGEVPGQVIGSVSSREVNATSLWLSQLVERNRLPNKLFVIHQFTDDMVDDRQVKPRKGLEVVLNVDGFGGRAVKTGKYEAFTRAAPRFNQGFKLFYREDTNLMTPRQVLRLDPPPDLVVYE